MRFSLDPNIDAFLAFVACVHKMLASCIPDLAGTAIKIN